MHVHVEIQMNCLTSISNIDTGPEVHGNAGRRTQVEVSSGSEQVRSNFVSVLGIGISNCSHPPTATGIKAVIVDKGYGIDTDDVRYALACLITLPVCYTKLQQLELWIES